MAFAEKLVGPEEKLIGVARLHWIYGMQGFMWLVALMMAGVFVRGLLAGVLDGAFVPYGQAIFWIGTFLGTVMAVFYFGMMLFTELALTTHRCIYKKGLIFVDVREIDLEEIKSVCVDNGYLGRIFNYGYIQVDARFIEDEVFQAITDPYRFVKAMNETRERLKEDSMHLVLEGCGISSASYSDGSENKKSSEDEEERHLYDARYDTLAPDVMHNIDALAEDADEATAFKAHLPPDDKNMRAGPQMSVPKGAEEEKKVQAPPKTKRTQPANSNASEPEAADQKPKSPNEEALNKTVGEQLEEKIVDDFEKAEQKAS